MKKVFLFMMVSLDGYFEGPHHQLDWHTVDEEFNNFASNQLDEIDTLIFGRKTYELMAAYWPTETASKNDPIIAEKMNSKTKIVFSKTLGEVSWNNTRLAIDNLVEEITKAKNESSKDIAIFGSSNLCISLLQQELLDELRIMINPVVLGEGTPLFKGIRTELKLRLVHSRTFKSGNVLLTYSPL